MTTAFSATEVQPVILAFPSPITEDVLLALGHDNPEYRFETTAEGYLVVTPLTGTFASGGEAELTYQLVAWNKRYKLGRVTPSTGGVTLADDATKGPDGTFISHARLASLSPSRKQRAFEKIAPNAVFELLSPSDSLTHTVSKCEEYVATGSDVAVLLNPRNRSVTLYRRGQEPITAPDITAVVIGDEMPHFILKAQDVFDAGQEPA